MERMGWTYDELMDAPGDVVADLKTKWRAEAEAERIRRRRGG